MGLWVQVSYHMTFDNPFWMGMSRGVEAQIPNKLVQALSNHAFEESNTAAHSGTITERAVKWLRKQHSIPKSQQELGLFLTKKLPHIPSNIYQTHHMMAVPLLFNTELQSRGGHHYWQCCDQWYREGRSGYHAGTRHGHGVRFLGRRTDGTTAAATPTAPCPRRRQLMLEIIVNKNTEENNFFGNNKIGQLIDV